MNMAVIALILLISEQDKAGVRNPWIDKAPKAIAEFDRAMSVQSARAALDAAYRADDWRNSLRIAEMCIAAEMESDEITGLTMRALWRAGKLFEAEALMPRVKANSKDPNALAMCAMMSLSRGDKTAAIRFADRLAAINPKDAVHLSTLAGVRIAAKQNLDVARYMEEIEKAARPENGYPDVHMAETISGMAAFFKKVGNEPLNEISAYGSVPMDALAMINLPFCEVYLNSKGPYRFVIDTGGSIMLSIDDEVAREVGLEDMGEASIHGISGKESSSQSLVNDVRMGDIRCKRVMARVFPLRSKLMGSADGIIGTGIFGNGRMTLDMVGGKMIVAPTSDAAAPGMALVARIIADAKLVTPVTVNSEQLLCFVDSGADVVALSPSILRRLFPDEPFDIIPIGGIGVGQGDPASIHVGPLVTLRIGERGLGKVPALGMSALDDKLGPILGSQTDVLVGMAILRKLNSLTIDFPTCRAWMDWAAEE